MVRGIVQKQTRWITIAIKALSHDQAGQAPKHQSNHSIKNATGSKPAAFSVLPETSGDEEI